MLSKNQDMTLSIGPKHTLGAAVLVLWLVGCGGGGGSEVQASPGGPIVNPSIPPTSSSEFVVFEDTASSELLSGSLDGNSWRTLAAYRRGQDAWSRLAAGRQLAVYRSASSQNDAVTLYELSSAKPVLTQEIPKNTVIAGPVFGDRDLFLLRSFVGASDGGTAFVVNLRTGKVVNTLASGGANATIDALPDGRMYRIDDKTGSISVGGADGVWTELGRLSIPVGTTLGSWRINHQGSKIAVVYQWFNAASATQSDVWVAEIDGSNQYRLTNQGYVGQALWSPDDSQVAFKFDTSSLLGKLTGHCSYWKVPVNAREVSGLSYDQPHPIAAQMRVNLKGIKNYSPCNVIAWER